MKRPLLSSLLLCCLWLLCQAQSGLAIGINIPLTFYGKVVDQDDKPLAGVKVVLEARADYFEENRSEGTKYNMQTDQNGNFILTGAFGSSVNVVTIEKEGYELSKKVKRAYVFTWGGDIFHPDPKEPVVFRMWKRHGGDSLVHEALDTRIPYDGQPVVFDLLHDKNVPDNGHSGDLRITLLRTPLKIKRGRQRYDWEATIEAVNGGLIESTNDFMYLAPNTGYDSKIEIGFKKDDPKWKSDKLLTFFLKSRNGGIYGNVMVEFRTDSEKSNTGLSINSWVNPTGSRNLEVEGSKISNAR